MPDLNLESEVNFAKFHTDLGLPIYLDQNDFQVKKAIGLLWLVYHYLPSAVPANLPKSLQKADLRLAFFGGLGFRIWCASANRPGSPFYRKLGDLDLITRNSDTRGMLELFSLSGAILGNEFSHWITDNDKRFNVLRGGSRFRVSGYKGVDINGEPIVDVVDIIVDTLRFCHSIPVDSGFTDPQGNLYTIGLENLIISKSQYIRSVKREEVPPDEMCRVMDEFDNESVLIGMEYKDIRDVGSAFYDHEVGEGDGEIQISKMGEPLKKDWGLYRTVTTNLNHLATSDEIWEVIGVDLSQARVIKQRIGRLCDELAKQYAVNKPWYSMKKRWWDIVDETK